jgi:two-component system response regulator YesN
MKQFRGKLQELEEALKNTFSYFSGVIYLAKTNFKDAAAVEEQLQMKESVIRSIEDKNLAAVREQMVIYLNRLEQEKSSSAFYVKYLVVDIVKAIFQAYGFYKETIIWQTAGDIMNCDDLQSVSRVLERVIDEMTENGEEPLPDVSAAVAAIKKVVKNEYMNDIGLEEIAEKVSLTPSYVSFIFKKETGNNLVKYLTDYRMKKAKELLEESNKKIGDIGRLCGYQNPSYFNKLFKNYYGVTPKQYREK